MLVKHSVSDIMQHALSYLQANTAITNFSAGSIARSIVESIAPEIGIGDDENRASLYQFMEDVLNQGYISQARGPYLDLIGGLFSFPRRYEQVSVEESGQMDLVLIDDETYRAEILQQVMSIMSSNYTALRFNLLRVGGVQDVIPMEYALGTGSFKFIIIPDVNEPDESILTACIEVVDRFKAFGVRPLLEFPTYVPVDLKIELQYLASTPDSKKGLIREAVRSSLQSHVLTMPLGGILVYNDIVQLIMNVSEEIQDFTVLHYAIDSYPVMLMNQSAHEEERFSVGTIDVTYL